MNQTNELPVDVKRLLLNLESDSQQVVVEAIKSLDKIGNTDPSVIMKLRKLAGEKTNWYIQTTASAFRLANKLSQQAEKENLQRLNDLINNNEVPDRDLLLRILQFRKEGPLMKPEGQYFARPWANVLLGIIFLFQGLTAFPDAILDMQNQISDIDSSLWPVIAGLSFAILFALGWWLSFDLEKFNRPLSEKWDFIVSIAFFPVLAVLLLIFALLAPSRLFIHIFASGMALFAGGLHFGLASIQKQKPV